MVEHVVWSVLVTMVICSTVPAVMFLRNLGQYIPPPPASGSAPSIAVLIPARDEEANMAAALDCVLASRDVNLEVFVLDDGSTDRTAAIVTRVAAADSRVRLLKGTALPAGWNGKQHACWSLAQASAAPTMLFLDADVRLAPDAIARMATFQRASGAALVSGFPRLITHSFLEWLLLPMIHFVLLAFLPLKRMRSTRSPALAAGCGQFLMAQREAYFVSGGHAAIRATMHDGLLLPRAFREAGFRTDLADLAELASVRMYDSAAKVWLGLAKNATEGLASPARILPITLIFLLGQVLPIMAGLCCGTIIISVLLVGAVYDPAAHFVLACGLVAVAVVSSFMPRVVAVRRFGQPLKSALMHPLGILVLLCVQWYALIRQVLGRPVGWRTRTYASASAGEVPQR